MPMNTILIASQKGGTAKSTTSLAVTRLLANQGNKVLLIDTDIQAHSTSSLMSEEERVEFADCNIFAAIGTKDLQANILTIEENIDLIPSYPSSVSIDNATIEELDNLLQEPQNKNNYDYIVIDTGPGVHKINLMAIRAAELVIIPIPMNSYAESSISDTLDLLEIHKSSKDIYVRILPTFYDKRIKDNCNWLEKVKELYSDNVMKPIPYRASVIKIKERDSHADKVEGLSLYEEVALIVNDLFN